MASTVKPHQRAFALTIALIFLVTTIATSALVVMSIIDQNKQDNTASQTEQTATDLPATDDQCAIASVEGQAALAAPEVFKPAGDVTALETTDLQAGDGQEVKAGDCIIAKYYGTLATSGTMFDENFTKDTALQVKIGTGSVISGWDEGIVGMKVGGTRRLVIPADKAYGSQDSGTIPANSDLVFVVKVTEIKK